MLETADMDMNETVDIAGMVEINEMLSILLLEMMEIFGMLPLLGKGKLATLWQPFPLLPG